VLASEVTSNRVLRKKIRDDPEDGLQVVQVSRGDVELAAARLARIGEFGVLEPTQASEELTVRLLADGIVPAVFAIPR